MGMAKTLKGNQMSLLVEYSIRDGKADAQTEALLKFVGGLKQIADGGYNYTCFETDDPKRFIGLLEFDDEDAKQRFLSSAPFIEYRESAPERFSAPPQPTQVRKIASTRD